jgi:photosystem II stability/assembly factor-like uncharacterized protein
VIALAALAVLGGTAAANGRRKEQIDLHFQPGSSSDVALAATWGLLFSHDGGETWGWLCENAVGFEGDYDPDYAVSATGTMFATTLHGMTILRDRCTFAPGPLGATIPRQITHGSDGSVLAALSDSGMDTPPRPADYKVYRSDDDGLTWNAGVVVSPTGGEIWQSLERAPSDPDRVYLTGHRLTGTTTFIMFRSDDGGLSFAPLSVAAFTTDDDTKLEIAAISPVDPDRVLVRVRGWGPVVGDAFWLSTDAGQSWTEVLRVIDNARGVVFRASGEVVIGSFAGGMHRSTDHGATFQELTTDHPNVGCLRERPGTNEVWACTQNLAEAPFDYSLMKTTDFVTWTGIVRLSEFDGPVICPVGTIQEDCCTCNTGACPTQNPPSWNILAVSIGNDNTVECAGLEPPDAGGGRPPREDCCGAGGGSPAAGMLLVIAVTVGRGRRRRA